MPVAIFYEEYHDRFIVAMPNGLGRSTLLLDELGQPANIEERAVDGRRPFFGTNCAEALGLAQRKFERVDEIFRRML